MIEDLSYFKSKITFFLKFSKKIPKKIWQFHKKSLPLHRISEITQLKHFKKKFWRDGRVVDCIGLENRRTERYRGFESLSLRITR